jgi:hypothetical protein
MLSDEDTERKIVDISAAEGFEVEEVSNAKDLVMDLFFTEDWGIPISDDGPVEPITIADTIVETLIDAGWRPTRYTDIP